MRAFQLMSWKLCFFWQGFTCLWIRSSKWLQRPVCDDIKWPPEGVYLNLPSTWVWLDVQRCFRRQPSCFCMLWYRLQWETLQQPISAAHSSNRWGHICLCQDVTCDQVHGLLSSSHGFCIRLSKYNVAGCDTFWELILRAEVVLNIMWDLMHLPLWY